MDYLTQCVNCGGTDFSELRESAAQMHPSDAVFQFQDCKTCRLVFLNPRLEPEELSAFYTDYYLPYRGAAAWGKHAKRVRDDQHKLDQRRVSHVAQFLDLDSSSTVLDLGCGKPDFLRLLKGKYDLEAMGIDFSDEGWSAQPELYAELQLIVGEVNAAPKTFAPDLVTMWHYLEHDYHPDRTLRQLHDYSAEGAIMVIEVPDHDSLGPQIYGGGWAGYHTPRHTFLFDSASITDLLAKQGWQVIDINRQGTLDVYNLFWMSEAERRGIDWSGSMESEFWPYVMGKVKHSFSSVFDPRLKHGIMTVTARKS